MSRKNLYLFALWLPLIVLAIVSIGEAYLQHYWWHQMSRATGYFLLGGILVGTQYLLFAALITWWFCHMRAGFLKNLSWMLPIMFFPICFCGLWVFFQFAEMQANDLAYYSTQENQDNILRMSIKLGVYSVICSYAYVFMVHMFEHSLQFFGLLLVEDDDEPPIDYGF
jgi:hypothetical protein